MIDLKFLRENPEIVKQNIKNKFQDQKLPLVDEVIELDAKARATQKEADEHPVLEQQLSEHYYLEFPELLQRNIHFSLQSRLCLEPVF